MDTELKSRRQVSLDQLSALTEFMKEHPELAKGLTRGRRGKLHTLKVWNLCAKKLNIIKDGAIKDGRGWSKYWCDWKYRIRRRALELKVAKDNNSSPPDGVTALTAMEENILDIIGENTMEGIVVKMDPLGDVESREDEVDNTENPEEPDLSLSEYYGSKSKSGKGKKRRQPSGDQYLDDGEGPSSPAERKPRISTANYGDHRDLDQDDEAAEFIRLEKEKLENSKRISQSIETIATEITRLADIMGHIRDVLINNRINI